MSKKQFSMEYYWNKISQDFEPCMRYKSGDFYEWQKDAVLKLKELLGSFPKQVPLSADIEWAKESDDGELITEYVVIDSEEHMSIPLIVNRPKIMKPDGTNAAILSVHGHGSYGKDPIAGIRTTQGRIDDINQMNYNYGEQMARHGYLTVSPDLRGFGERSDGGKPFPGRDLCNVNFIKGAIMGVYSFMLNIWDMKCCIDYIESRAEVNKNKIGMMGLSYGGTMTCFTSAIEPRIKAVDIIGYVNPFKDFGIKDANFCGSQIVPEIYKYFDTDDIAGLIAPRPLLVEMGKNDECFAIESLKKGFEGIKYIYKAAGAEDRLFADVHNGPHAFAGNMAFAFFDKYLKNI